MTVLVMIALTVLFSVSLTLAHGPHHPRGSYKHYRPPVQNSQDAPKLTQDTQLLRDEEHIKEDLSQYVAPPDISQLPPQELEFHYFKVHDFDNNSKLDGLEILQAIKHTIHSHDQEKIDDAETSAEEFEHYVELIDRVLEEDDLDKDGYLSYIEYVVGRQRDEKEREASQ